MSTLSFPPKAIIIETSYYDRQAWIIPMCARCKYYANHVDSRVATGGLNVSVRRMTLASLIRLQASHECPPEVTAAAEGTSDTRPAAELSTGQLRDGATLQTASGEVTR